MNYKNIEDALAKRAAKEEATASKGVRGREGENTAPEAGKAKKARRSEVKVPEDDIAAAGSEDCCSVLQL